MGSARFVERKVRDSAGELFYGIFKPGDCRTIHFDPKDFAKDHRLKRSSSADFFCNS